MTEKEILEKYKLSEEEHERYYQIIKRVYFEDKHPIDSPIAVIIGGQTGAGKSGIIGYSTKMFLDENVIIINSDEIKPFHPKSEEIAKLYPNLYTKITDQESNTWTSKIFEYARQNGYNIIFEGTMKNNRIADESITELQSLGYTTIVRGLACCDLESRISILERYEAQVSTKGWGRLVVTEHHNQTYEGMPNTIDYIEKTGKYDILEIFARGDKIAEPIILYSVFNPQTEDKSKISISRRECVSKYTRTYGYSSAKDAINGTREDEYGRVIVGMKERLKKIINSMQKRDATKEEKQMVLDLMETFEKKKNDRLKKNNKDESLIIGG